MHKPIQPGPGGGNRPDNKFPNRPDNKFPNRPDNKFPNRPDNKFPNRPDNKFPNRPDNKFPNRPDNKFPNRPDNKFPNRPGNRPINIGDVNIGNKVINNRPKWANIDNNKINNINNRWGNQVGNMQNWDRRHPDRIAYNRRWGDDVRRNWGHHHHHHNYFNNDWWRGHHHGLCGWHYGYSFNRYNASYWWTAPTYATAVNWFPWAAQSAVWTQPVYYDYGQGGNVVYNNNAVYVNDQQVATADEFAQSAAALATVPPPASEEEAEKAEWLPLGTFAVASNAKDMDPSRVIQLAVDKQGVISGTLYNTQTDQAQSVQGQVDKQTQRVAFRIGESDNIVVETGLYNLTQQEAPVLVHFGADKVENWLLVRLEQPEDGGRQQP